MDKARDQNIATIAAKIILVQETSKDKQSGILMYVPVYRLGMPLDSVLQRRAAFRGFVYSPIRMNDFVIGTLGKLPQDIAFEINATSSTASDTLMFSSIKLQQTDLPDKYKAAITSSSTIQSFGCNWQFSFTTLPEFNKELNREKSYLVFMTGIAFSMLLTYVVMLVLQDL